MQNARKYLSELLGTFVLVFVGCGVIIWTQPEPYRFHEDVMVVALAFGLITTAIYYSLGNVSGCHINPAVSLAMFIRKELSLKDFLFYVLSQFVGATLGALALGLAYRGEFSSLGSNEMSYLLQPQPVTLFPDFDGNSYFGAFAIEVILTAVYVLTFIGATDKKRHDGKLAGLIIGGTLISIHLLGSGFTGTSVNPARSFGPALLEALLGSDSTSLSQIWIWILAPLVGGALAAFIYTFLAGRKNSVKTE